MKDAPEYLKTVRLKRGWTLQDASDRSRINITVLRALESGKTSEVGSPLTVEALVARYSAALGVETRQCEARPLKAEKPAGGSRALLHMMYGLAIGAVLAVVCLGIVLRHQRVAGLRVAGVAGQASTPQGAMPVSVAQPAPPASATSKVKPTNTASPQLETPRPAAGAGQRVAGAGLPACKIAAVSPAAGAAGPDSTPKSDMPVSVAQPGKPVAVDNTKARVFASKPAPGPESRPVATLSQKPPLKTPALHSLEIVADRKTWIGVEIDGRKAQSALLQPGQTRQWEAGKKVYLIVGNAGGVHITWDGKPVTISRTPGRVVRLRLPG